MDRVDRCVALLIWPVVGLSKVLSSPTMTAGIADDDLIFLMDGLDVWLQLPPEVMARRFMEYDADIIAAAEKNCAPNWKQSPECVDAPLSPIPVGIFRKEDYREDEGYLSDL